MSDLAFAELIKQLSNERELAGPAAARHLSIAITHLETAMLFTECALSGGSARLQTLIEGIR